MGLPTPDALAADSKLAGIGFSELVDIDLSGIDLPPNYCFLRLGISFVSKVAPPKYKGMMMGGWFVATAIGNYLVAIIGYIVGRHAVMDGMERVGSFFSLLSACSCSLSMKQLDGKCLTIEN